MISCIPESTEIATKIKVPGEVGSFTNNPFIQFIAPTVKPRESKKLPKTGINAK